MLGFCPRWQEGMLGVGVSAWLAAGVAPVPSVQSLFLQLGSGEMLLEPGTGEKGMGLPRNKPPLFVMPLEQDPSPLYQLSTFRLQAGKALVACKLTPA